MTTKPRSSWVRSAIWQRTDRRWSTEEVEQGPRSGPRSHLQPSRANSWMSCSSIASSSRRSVGTLATLTWPRATPARTIWAAVGSSRSGSSSSSLSSSWSSAGSSSWSSVLLSASRGPGISATSEGARLGAAAESSRSRVDSYRCSYRCIFMDCIMTVCYMIEGLGWRVGLYLRDCPDTHRWDPGTRHRRPSWRNRHRHPEG